MTTRETEFYTIKTAPFEDIGKDRVRLHWRRRLGRKRFAILRLEHQGKSAVVSALGHEGDEDDIQMDLDLRQLLAVQVGQQTEITVSAAGWINQLRWYLFATDPAVRIPALVGAWSFIIGALSLLPIQTWLGGLTLSVVETIWSIFSAGGSMN